MVLGKGFVIKVVKHKNMNSAAEQSMLFEKKILKETELDSILGPFLSLTIINLRCDPKSSLLMVTDQPN